MIAFTWLRPLTYADRSGVEQVFNKYLWVLDYYKCNKIKP